MADFWGAVNSFRDQLYRTSSPIMKPTAKTISITAGDLYTKSNYQDFERFLDVDIAMGHKSFAPPGIADSTSLSRFRARK